MKEQIQACQEALQLNPNDQQAFDRLSTILRDNRRWKALVGLYEAYPNLADWQNLVDTLSDVAEHEESAEKKSGVFHVIGQICEMRLQRADIAITFYQKAVRAWAGRTESFDAARRIYTATENYKMVVRLLQLELGVVTNEERKVTLLMELSQLCREKLGDIKNADEFEEKARSLNNVLVDTILTRPETTKTAEKEVREEAREITEKAENQTKESTKAAEEAKEAKNAAEKEAKKAAKKAARIAAEEEAKKAAEEEAKKAAEEEAKKAAEEEAKKAAEEEAKKAAEEEVEAVIEEVAEAVIEEVAEAAVEAVIEEVAEAVIEEVAEAAVEAVIEEVAEAAVEEVAVGSLADCCELIYRSIGDKKIDVRLAAEKGASLVSSADDALALCEALEEVKAYDVLAATIDTLARHSSNDREKRFALACYADVLDRHLGRREEAVAMAATLAEGEDRAAFKARAILAGTDEKALGSLAATMQDTLKKLRRTPEEFPFMLDTAKLYVDRLHSLKDAEELYKRIKLADSKNYSMLKFNCLFYASNEDWQRMLSSLQTLKAAVSGSYRELDVARQIATISEDKLGNPGKAVNVWNQMLKDGCFADIAREELIGLYQRTQKWQALLDIYKNDMEALGADQVGEHVTILQKCIEIYDEHLRLDAMVIKMYHQILDIDPGNEKAVTALIERYEASKRWNDLLKILTQKAQATKDPEQSIDIYYRIATLWSTNLGNVAKSVEPLLNIIEIDPTQRKALKQLHEFYEQRNAWSNLYDILEKEAVVSDTAEAISLLKRQAEIGETNLRSTEKAISSWEAISQLLKDPSEALEELTRLYDKLGDNAALLKVYERRLEASHSEAERIENIDQIARLYLERLDARDKGIETYREMLAFEAGRDRALNALTQIYVADQAWDALVALYVSLDRSAQVYELLDLTTGDQEDDNDQIALYERMAAVASEQLHDDNMTVAALEKILDIDTTHEKTAKRLLAYYMARGEYAKAINAIQIIIAWTSDLEEKIAMHVEIARLFETELADIESAMHWYAKAVQLAPQRSALREHFEALVEKGEGASKLYEVYADIRDHAASLDDASRLAIHRILARTCQRQLGKFDEAITSWEFCLQADETDTEAIDALCELYEHVEHWENLLHVLDRKLVLCNDENEEKSLHFKRAELLVHQLKHLQKAEASYYRILEIDSANIEALNGLKSIYTETESWTKLAEMLRKELELLTENHLEVAFALAEVERTKLDHLDRAIELYASILDENPQHVQTIKTTEALIEVGVQRHRLAALLEPVYKASAMHNKLCHVLEIRLETLEDADKLPVWWEIYELRHDALQDLPGAFEAAVHLFKLNPEDERVWHHLETLAETNALENAFARISALYGDIATDEDDHWRFAILRRKARIVEEKLSDAAASVALWEMLHRHEPDDLEAIQHLENLYKADNAFEKLVKLYEFKVNLPEFDDDSRIQILLEAAQIYEDILSDAANAIRVYNDVLTVNAMQADALAALERLYIANQQWDLLAKLYDDELTLYSDPAKLQNIRRKLANVSDVHLADYARAIDCYKTVLETDSHDKEAIASADALLKKLTGLEDEKAGEYRAALCELLEPIYTANRALAHIVDILRIRLSASDDVYERMDLNRRIASILRDDMHDRRGAFEALHAALKDDLSDASLRADFETLALELDEAPAIIALYEAGLESVDDVVKHSIYQRMATIFEEHLNDSLKAIEAYRAIVAIDEMDTAALNALETLYTNAQSWPELIGILKLKADNAAGDDKMAILQKMALINQDCLSSPKAAIENYRELLDIIPDDLDALNALESLYTQTENWEHLVENYTAKLHLANDNETRRSILQKMACLREEKLKAYDEAITLHNQILDLYPENEDTLDALDRLYQHEEQYSELAGILERKLALHREDDSASALEYRLGQIYSSELSSTEQAIEYYRSILARDPRHEDTLKALNTLLKDESYRLEASRVLEPVFERTEQYADLIQILEIQLELEVDPNTQIDLLRRIAALHQDKLSNYAGAFNAFARIVLIDQQHDDLEQIEALSEVLDNTHALVDVYKRIVEAVYDPEAQVTFNNKIAALLLNRLADEAEAEKYYRATLEISATDTTALNALDALYTQKSSWASLLAILDSKLQADFNAESQRPILYRMAGIQETLCHLPEEAIATFLRILELDATQIDAIKALERLYAQQEMWQDLADLLLSEIQAAEDQEEGVALKFRLAQIQYEKLRDEDDAIQTLRDILNLQPEFETAIAYLETLFESGIRTTDIAEILEPLYKRHNRWQKLIHSLESRIGLAEDDFSKVQILQEMAQTYEQNLHDDVSALRVYGRILNLQPADTDTQAHIERLASKTLALETWAEFYEAILKEEKLEYYADKRVLMISLARLQAERLGNMDKARALCREMLEEEAEEVEAYDILEWIAAQARDYSALLALWTKKLDVLHDPDEKANLMLRIATIQEEILRDDKAACTTYHEINDITQNALHAASLERLLRKTSQFAQLAEFYQQQIDLASGVEDRVELLHKLGVVLERELRQTDEAIDALRQALEISPKSSACKRAVETMLSTTAATEENAEIRFTMATMLEPLYTPEEWQKLVRVLDVMIASTDDNLTRVDLYLRQAAIFEAHDAHRERAFATYAKAFVAAPSSKLAHDKVLALAAELENDADLANVYMEAIANTDDVLEKLQLNEHVAVIWHEKIKDLAKAAACYEAILAQDDQHLGAIQALESIYSSEQNHLGLVTVLKRHAELVTSVIDKKDLLYRIAELEEKTLKQLQDAIDTYLSVLDLDAEDSVALDALEKLYRQTENWKELILTYQRKIDASGDSSERIELLTQVAIIFRDRLDDMDGAIENYLLAQNENHEHIGTLEALEALYTKAQRYDDLLDNLQTQADLYGRLGEGTLKHANALKMAQILINKVDDKPRAIEILRDILQDDPNVQDAIDSLNTLLGEDALVEDIAAVLMPIYRESGNDRAWLTLCERKIAACHDDFEKRSLYLEAAKIADENLNDADAAFGFVAAALKANPTDDDIIDNIRHITERHERFASLTALCKQIVENSDDSDVILKLSLLAAKIDEENLGLIDEAIALYENVLSIDGFSDIALVRLHHLYQQTSQSEKLADILQRRIDAGAANIQDIRYELAMLKKAGAPAEALELLKQILWDEPDHEQAVEAMESMLKVSGLTSDIAETLEPYYTRRQLSDKLATLLCAKIEATEDAIDRLGLYKQLAALERDTRHNAEAALDAYQHALAIDASDADVLRQIEDLASELGQWETLIHACTLAIEKSDDATTAIALHAKIADIASQKLGDNKQAVEALTKAHALDENNLEILHKLEALYEHAQDSNALLDTKDKIANLTYDSEAQKAILFQCADLALNTINDNTRGMSFLERIIEFDDSDLNAIDPLLVLYEEGKLYNRYVDLLQKKLLCTSDNAARLDIFLKIARTSAEALNDPASAIDAYRNALDIERHSEIYSALEALYLKHEQFQELDDLIVMQLDDASDDAARAQCLVRRADIAMSHFHDKHQAIDYLKQALQYDPTNAEAFNGIDRLYSEDGNFQDLLELLQAQKEAARSQAEITALNIRIANLAATHLNDEETAIDSLQAVLQSDPVNIDALSTLIKIYEQQKAYDLALGALRRKLDIVDSHVKKADIYCHVGRLIQAANWNVAQVSESYEAALKLNAANIEALDALMEIARKAGDVKRQLALLNIRADNENDPQAKKAILNNIANTAIDQLSDYDLAAQALSQIYAATPEDIELGERLINAFIRAEQVSKAEPILNGIIERLTESKQTKSLPPFFSLRGRLLKQRGDLSGAREAFEAAQAIDKNNIANNIELGILLYDAADYEAALKIMQTLLLHQMNIKEKDLKVSIFYYLGMLRLKTDDPKRAKDMFTRALGVDANHAPSKEALASLG